MKVLKHAPVAFYPLLSWWRLGVKNHERPKNENISRNALCGVALWQTGRKLYSILLTVVACPGDWDDTLLRNHLEDHTASQPRLAHSTWYLDDNGRRMNMTPIANKLILLEEAVFQTVLRPADPNVNARLAVSTGRSNILLLLLNRIAIGIRNECLLHSGFCLHTNRVF